MWLVVMHLGSMAQLENVGVFEAEDSGSAKLSAVHEWGMTDDTTRKCFAIRLGDIRNGWSYFT